MLLDEQTALPQTGRMRALRTIRDCLMAAVMFFAVFAATWQVISSAHPDAHRLLRRHKHQLIKIDESLAHPMVSVCWDRG